MQNQLFKILNLDVNATAEEIASSYEAKRKQLREDMFLEGYKGNEAARDLTTLENAYADYLEEIRYQEVKANEESQSYTSDAFQSVEAFVKADKLNEAQNILDDITDRTAAWHYYQSMVYYKKDWFTDSKRHLEKACELDPVNSKYETALEKLKAKMGGESQRAQKSNPEGEWWKQNTTVDHDKDHSQWDDNNRQMGGCDSSMNCCTQLLCANLLCNCCGGGC